jgi:hypothetical protein
MTTSIRQGFVFERADIQRAKTAAAQEGLSMNEWMRRAVRAAFNGPKLNTQTSDAAFDTSALDAIAQRLADLLGRGEADAAASRTIATQIGGQIEQLSKVGSGLRAIEDRMASGTMKPLPARVAPSAVTGARSA